MARTKPRPRTKKAKGDATSGKSWRTRGRLALIDLEPDVERMLVSATPMSVIVAWCVARGADASHVPGLVRGIKARWLACETAGRAERIAAFRQRLDVAWHQSQNRPTFHPKTGLPLLNEDGSAVTFADLQAGSKLLKLMMELDGLAAPTKVAHLHGHLHLDPAAMSPAERQAEIEELLAKHAAAAAAGAAPDLPVAPPESDAPPEVIDVDSEERAPARQMVDTRLLR